MNKSIARRGAALAAALAVAFLLPANRASAEAPEQLSQAEGASPAARPIYKTRARIDWSERVFKLDIELDLAAAGLKMPQGRLDAERMIERDIGGLEKDAVFALQADSHRTIGDAVEDGSFDADRLVELVGIIRTETSSFSKDMRFFRSTYTLGLESLSSLFLSGGRPTPVRPPLEERAGRTYSGIVIYAKGSLPVHGEGVEDTAKPCLFPRIYDSDMNLVLDKGIVAPEVLAEAGSAGGVLGYASGLGVEAGSRVGGDPLRVMAIELFGDGRTDYIISREDALRILSGEANRELLRQGKVVVVLDLGLQH
jgi:hypothetical protein